MQFQVPQFIEHEPKVIGPFTFTQFVYIGVAGAAALFLYFILPVSLFFISAIVLGAVGFGLAFVKVAGKSLPAVLLNVFTFSISPKTYIWKRGRMSRAFEKKSYVQKKETPVVATISHGKPGRIKDLSIKVETRG